MIDSKKIIYCPEKELEKISEEEVKKILKPKIQKDYIKLVQDFNKLNKHDYKIKEILAKLKEFNENYPYQKSPEKIENLTSADLFKEISNQMGIFFLWIVYELEGLGSLNLYVQVYREASKKLEKFKKILYTVIDPQIKLSDKIDAPWHKIKGMGGDKHLAKKLICCFDEKLIPIFNTKHLEHYFNIIVGKDKYPSDYNLLSLGEKYEFLMESLLRLKNELEETRNWENLKFSIFLYENYPPPGKEKWVKI